MGRLSPNDFGLFDMAGEVHQWCLDDYDKSDVLSDWRKLIEEKYHLNKKVLRMGSDRRGRGTLETTSTHCGLSFGFRVVYIRE